MYKTYKEWFQEIKWLKDKIILPDNRSINKIEWIKKDGFDINSFNSFLFKTYNEIYPVKKDGKRYKI